MFEFIWVIPACPVAMTTPSLWVLELRGKWLTHTPPPQQNKPSISIAADCLMSGSSDLSTCRWRWCSTCHTTPDTCTHVTLPLTPAHNHTTPDNLHTYHTTPDTCTHVTLPLTPAHMSHYPWHLHTCHITLTPAHIPHYPWHLHTYHTTPDICTHQT